MAQAQPKPLTGRKVFAITASAFAVIIGVNLVMAYVAIDTFPGLEVRNSYVASQGFNDRLETQRALGWETDVDLTGNQLTLRFTDATGEAVEVETLAVTLGRPTTEREDFTPVLRYQGGAYRADVDIDFGNWLLIVQATAANGDAFNQRIGLTHNR